ncbi:MAG: hypothetical protein WCS72_10855 [Deltaproteobacteria bacterium]
MKAPRTCPKSSLASNPSVKPPQFTATNGPFLPLRRWRRRATISFPVPVSPVTTTVRGWGATASMLRRTASMEGVVPVSSGWPWFRSSGMGSSRSRLV